jgi:beta-glucosidase
LTAPSGRCADRAEAPFGPTGFTARGEAAARRRLLTALTTPLLLPLIRPPHLCVKGVGAQTASLYGDDVADPAHAADGDPGTDDGHTHAGLRPSERPAVLRETAAKPAALVADHGTLDEALLDVAFGRARAEARLPFEPPRSMAAVAAPRPDVPDDTEDPVVPYGHGPDAPKPPPATPRSRQVGTGPA